MSSYLEDCLKKSYAIQAKPRDEDVEFLGTIQCGDFLRDVYKGENGHYWNQRRYMGGNRIISE